MIRITNVKLHIGHPEDALKNAVLKKLRIPDTRLLDFMIVRKSIDARDKSDIRYVYTIDASVKDEALVLRKNRSHDISAAETVSYRYPPQGEQVLMDRPLIIGSGPCGLFAAYFLAREGYQPIVIERGDPVQERIRKVRSLWEDGILDPDSNIQFGEGGAGTFSDGKLNTGVHDPKGRNRLVLETFVENGAPEEILYQNKPHLGTDVLEKIVANMRRYILDRGGEYHFRTCFKNYLAENGQICGIETTKGEIFSSRFVVLAIGHSARDTFETLLKDPVIKVSAKAFAVGVRVEHPQDAIGRAQYGEHFHELPPADYKLTYKTSRGSSVYSFCMCPGGYVVNSSSEAGYQCINGMSYSGRGSDNANAAIVVAVHPSDDASQNLNYQKSLEKRAFEKGQGRIISQRLEDFINNRPTDAFGAIRPVHKGQTVTANIREVLPEELCLDIMEAMHFFGGKIKGFDDPDVILSALESRTSSPVRIERNEQMESAVKGLYPAGEGAGYAGGITSAAIDGIKVFEAIYSAYRRS